MKFPKSMHAEGWANHIDTTPSDKPKASAAPLHAAKAGAKPLAGARPLTSGTRMDLEPPVVVPTMTNVPPVPPRIEPRPAAARPQAEAVMRPSGTDQNMPWIVAAAGGAAIIGGLAFWAFNRPDVPVTPPAIVTGSTEPQTQVAAATPEPPPAADRDTAATDDTATTSSAKPAEPAPAPEPARLGPPVTTVKPAIEPRQVAQAPAPAPRPDLVVRANPRNPAPAPTPYLQPTQPVAAVPAAEPQQPQQPAVTPGTAPITLPPTAAGPAPTVTPAPGTPEPAVANSTSPGTPPLAQAATPTPEDSGITVKVRSALAADATLAAVPIAVSTDHGVVKLEGQAPDAPTRERATVVAASAAGVKSVDNRLTLPPTTVSQAPTSSGF